MRDSGSARRLVILGGGVAGLGVGYYARQHGLPITIIEAGAAPGGNARTLAHGPFRFDTGAHRFHDRYADVTADIKALLGPELREVNAPSQIHWNDRFVDFPLTPVNLVRSLGVWESGRAGWDLVSSRLRPGDVPESFEATALRTYGRTIARHFLLGYSEKLWGVSGDRLSPSVAGRRLQGLSALLLLKEVLRLSTGRSRHLEGRFYYPTHGIGMIADRLADACGSSDIRLGARVTRLVHRDQRIVAVELNHGERLDVSDARVVSTLPPGVMADVMSPAVPDEVRAAAKALRFRNLILVTVFLNRPSVTTNATIYFPEPACPFTRISEPRNRSPLMAPPGKTSLSIEIPCWMSDNVWREGDGAVVDRCVSEMARIGLVTAADVEGAVVHRLPFAYPVLEIGAEARVAKVEAYLGRFTNLHLTGRSGRFAYVHLHDLLHIGRELVGEIVNGPARSSDRPAEQIQS